MISQVLCHSADDINNVFGFLCMLAAYWQRDIAVIIDGYSNNSRFFNVYYKFELTPSQLLSEVYTPNGNSVVIVKSAKRNRNEKCKNPNGN